MLLTNNITWIGQMKPHNCITLVTMITCVGLHLFSCPGPTGASDEAITTTSLPSALKLTPGECVTLGSLWDPALWRTATPSLCSTLYWRLRLHLVQNSTSPFALPPPSTLGVKEASACYPERLSSSDLEGTTCVCVGSIFCSRPSRATWWNGEWHCKECEQVSLCSKNCPYEEPSRM